MSERMNDRFYEKPKPQSLVNAPQIISIEESLKRAEELEIKMLDIIINYYKGVLEKGIENIKTETVINDLEEIKNAMQNLFSVKGVIKNECRSKYYIL